MQHAHITCRCGQRYTTRLEGTPFLGSASFREERAVDACPSCGHHYIGRERIPEPPDRIIDLR